MLPQTSSTRCVVDIIAPSGRRVTFRSQEPDTALLAVETTKDLREACGSFTLHFAPGTDAEGRRWDQVIPKRSLVFIDMERPGSRGLPEVHPTVMVGLTDDHSMQEEYSEAHPRRRVQIHGRELSSVLVDATLWFDMALLAHPEYGRITIQRPSNPTLGLTGELQLALSHDPNMAVANEDPRTTIKRILNYYLFIGGESVAPAPAQTPTLQQPVISLDMPDTKLADVLQMNASAWTLFEDGVTVPIRQHPAATGSLWNYLHVYIDRAFQEFFTRMEDGVCKIHFRGKPFQHAKVASGTRFQSADEAPTLQTLTLDPVDLVAQHVSTLTSNVYNVFKVGPRGISALYKIPEYAYAILPQIITDATHPSFVGRYGLRVMQVESPYLSPLAPEEEAPQAVAPSAAPQPLTPAPAGASTWASVANQIAAAHGIPAEQRPWFVALIHQESGFNPNARHKNSNGTEDQGIAQFHTPYPVGVTLSDPFNPVEALGAAAQYWNILRTYAWIGNDPRMIVAGYNGGPSGVQHGLSPAVQRHVAAVATKVPTYAAYGGTSTVQTLPQTPKATRGVTVGVQGMITTAQRWAALLCGWYEMGGELFGGQLTVRGHPAWNVGHRLLSGDSRGPWEAYIEGVGHRFDLRTGQYLSTLRITRGWYLSDAIAQQIREEGQTQVTATSGGPPEVDPASAKEVLVAFPHFPEVEPR